MGAISTAKPKSVIAKGYDVVYARRTAREGETTLKRLTAHMFYRVINMLADQPIPADVGDFRLMSRRAVDAVSQLRERHRFMKGLFSWIGFRQTEVPVRARAARGRTHKMGLLETLEFLN